jgi:hypothetical protein
MAVPDYFAVVAMIGWQTGGKPPLGPGDCNPLAQRIIYGRRTAAAHRQLTLTISSPLGTRTTGISLARGGCSLLGWMVAVVYPDKGVAPSCVAEDVLARLRTAWAG